MHKQCIPPLYLFFFTSGLPVHGPPPSQKDFHPLRQLLSFLPYSFSVALASG